MTGVKVNFEIGHEASVRSKKTPEGFTHDWEVFVRGQEGADISHFVDKVVFQLHETFPKPRRVVKDPPFTIKESGYAGFMFPIEIYLKNKDEPKKITFSYDFTLQQSGFLRDRYIFPNPNDDFKKKLLKGGGTITSINSSYYTNPDQENQGSRSRESFSEEKQQLLSKPKLSSENVKKHKVKEHKDEVPHKISNFENLFGPPIQKPPKVSPEPKKLEKVSPAPAPKMDKKEKDRSSSDKKSKHEHKESKPDKNKTKEEKEKSKQDKIRKYNKEQEKSKEKAIKRPCERPPSPDVIKKSRMSPKRPPPSPPPRSSSASSMKEEYKVLKHSESESRKPKPEEKPPEHKPDKEKKKKEKKSHDRDKDRKERKEHKKENHKGKESPSRKEVTKEIPKEVLKPRDIPKDKEPMKDTTPVKEKQYKPDKPINKLSLENVPKTPPSADIEERLIHHKNKDKSDSERKHKHKKKDKKRDESKDKHKESSKEKKHKEKVREILIEKPEVIEHRDTPVLKEPPPQELGSPISIDTASQCSSKSGLAKTSQRHDDINSGHSDSESSIIPDEDDKPKPIPSPEPIKEPSPEPEVEPELEPLAEVPPPKEKSKKHKEKSSKREEKREEKRRKRKAAEEEDVERKVAKAAVVAEPGPAFIETERGESSGSVTTETKVQDNGVSSSLGEDAEPGDLSPDYMVQLRDLQQRIMKIKNNDHLERVVNLIAETGRYEVTTQTFDFDLCLLDRSTVQQLIQLVGC